MTIDFHDFSNVLQEQKPRKLAAMLKNVVDGQCHDAQVRISISGEVHSTQIIEHPYFSYAIHQAYNGWVIQDALGDKAERCVALIVHALKNLVAFDFAFFMLSGREDALPYLRILQESGQQYDLDQALVNACRNRCLSNALYLIDQGANHLVLDENAILIALRYRDVEFADGLSMKVDYTAFSKEIMAYLRTRPDTPHAMIDRFYQFEDEHQQQRLSKHSKPIHPYVTARYQADLMQRHLPAAQNLPSRKPKKL